jgi:hypothetical protein
MYRTQDGGKTFVQVGVGTFPSGMKTGSRNHPEEGFLATDGVQDGYRYFYCRDQPLYRSTDHGATWTALARPFGTAYWVQGMAVDQFVAKKIWATASDAGVRYSNDGGDTWIPLGLDSNGKKFTYATHIDAANRRVAVWGKRTGDTFFKLYFSPDDGVTWTEATDANNRYAHARAVAVDPQMAGKVWVSGISGNVITGLPGAVTPTPTPAPTATPVPTATPTPTQPPSSGTGTGLKGEYYSTATLSTLVKTQTDSTVNFDWGSGNATNTDGTAMSSVGPDNFSVRWTGQVHAIEGGSYTFTTTTDVCGSAPPPAQRSLTNGSIRAQPRGAPLST